MEGFLLIPPDRGTILGRAVWKARFVVLGSPFQRNYQSDALPRSASSQRLQAARRGLISAPRPLGDESPQNIPETTWLSVYKQKGDSEAISQHLISSIKSCEIQGIQHRKPGPSLPTLIITFEVDTVTDKSRKRRSSRAGTLSSSSNTFPNSILFRSIPEEACNIYDWQMAIQPLIKNSEDIETPLSPTSPISPKYSIFGSTFATRAPPSGYSSSTDRTDTRPSLRRGGSSGTVDGVYRQYEASATFPSPSPSLRSKRSDISSQASNGYPALPIQHPSDIFAPSSTAPYEDQGTSAWIPVQGRSSALSNHTRGSTSVSTTGTPPAPAQSILDRAFQMRKIPGTGQVPDEEMSNISSIARFEALMRETDERMRASKMKKASDESQGWSVGTSERGILEEEDEDDYGKRTTITDGRLYSTQLLEKKEEMEMENEMDALALPTPAQRALEYIAGRNVSSSTREANFSRGEPRSFGLHSASLSMDSMPVMPQSLSSMVNSPGQKRKSRPTTIAMTSSGSGGFDGFTSDSATPLKRRSSSSTNQFSTGDFTKRLSSGSSLLLVQTNNSLRSSVDSQDSRRSGDDSDDGEIDFGRTNIGMHEGLSQARLSGVASPITGFRAAENKPATNSRRFKEGVR